MLEEGTNPDNPPSLSVVFDEMKSRVDAQERQAQALAAKSAFLFTAGTAAIGAVGAVVGTLMDGNSASWRLLLWPGVTSFGAYVFLLVCFVQAYRVREFQRAPQADRLLTYLYKPQATTKHNVADAHRATLVKNKEMLDAQGTWINYQLIALVVLIGGLAEVLISLLIS